MTAMLVRAVEQLPMLVRHGTIAALSTASGRGAIAIVRLSGSDAHVLASRILHPWPSIARRVVRSTVRDVRDGSLIDDALVTRFDAPRSYTGESMVEIACHGGVAVSAAVLELLTLLGARAAEPGEFTQRAVLNGKLDLLQAEAVADLVDARTHAMRRAAVRQLDGGLSRALTELRERMLSIEALLAYDIDFPEEDDGPISHETIRTAARGAHDAIERLLTTVPLGEIARDGAMVVIAGPPNAGKSSLFNALLGETRAIVTDIPGTTRDAIEARVESDRWPLRLVDTAGLRSSTDVIERLGIEVSEEHIRAAHVVLACAESLHELADILPRVKALAPATVLAVLTKADLLPSGGEHAGQVVDVEVEEHTGLDGIGDAVAVSATARTGLDRLLHRIHRKLEQSYGDVSAELPIVTRARHQVSLDGARREVQQFLSMWESRATPATVVAVHIRTATHLLDELIGSVDVEDILDRVFSSFCVGK